MKKTLERIIFVIGLLTLGFLFWKMDPREVLRLLTQVGWGFALIIGQEIAPHIFNTFAWIYAFDANKARSFRFLELFELRIIGDSVNYLTPSGTVAGEFTRAASLSPAESADVRVASVLVAKCAQALAQMLFVLFGLATVVHGAIPALKPYERFIRAAAALAAGGLGMAALWPARKASATKTPSVGRMQRLSLQLKCYIREHPGRSVASIVFFMAGFAWGAFEAYWICRFLGLAISVKTALAIEVLSNLVDGFLFMVPAKIGTQEAGRTAVFVLLGLKAQTGFTFGLVRHIRELTWACAGMLLYSLHLKKKNDSLCVHGGTEGNDSTFSHELLHPRARQGAEFQN